MKETRFISQNKEKWLESENLLKARAKDPEKLTNLFTQVIDDLSYSRTYYPNRSVRVYLNKLGREYFSIIYKNRKTKKNRIAAFWTDELPQIVYNSRKPLLISLVVFLLSASIGVFSAMNDPQFTSSILGESYVEMTKQNIANGDPMAVYKHGHQMDMFLGITLNNLMVAFRTYVFGVFLSIGTLAILLYNGIMVGCFQYFFVERGLLAESALTIWLHGTLEISSIILAGGAGLILGSGLLFPGTYSRLQAFQISAIRSLKLMLGITPIFIVAGIIESFLTRYTQVPDVIRLLLILLSAGFIVGYFIIYPWRKAKSGFDKPLEEVRLPPTQFEKPSLQKIKNNGELVKDGFLFYKRYANSIFPWVLVVTLLMAITEMMMSENRSTIYLTEWYVLLMDTIFYGFKTPSIQFVILNTLGSSFILYRVNVILSGEAESGTSKRYNAPAMLQSLVIIGSIYLMVCYIQPLGIIMILFLFVVFLLHNFVQHFSRKDLLSATKPSWGFAFSNFAQVLGLNLILILLAFSFLIVLSAPVYYINKEVLQWNLAKNDEWAKQIIHFAEIYLKILGLNLFLPLMGATCGYLYFTLKEIADAEHLKRAIEMIGIKTGRNRR